MAAKFPNLRKEATGTGGTEVPNKVNPKRFTLRHKIKKAKIKDRGF